jgi:dipeptidyl aminopeptidase/acylaminoacyl peptidase
MQRSLSLRWSFAAVVLIGLCTGMGDFAFAQSTQPTRPLTVDDLFAIRRVGDPQISPDGQWVAYTITTTSLEDEESETRIWMAPTAGGEAIPMTGKGSSASRPRFSPDGKYLSFQAARDGGKSQVWTLNRMGGEAQQLTDVSQGISSYDWSPDGTRLVLTIKDRKPGDEEEESDEESETPEPWVIDRLQFKRDYAGYLDTLRTHLHVFDVAGKSLTQITSGRYDESRPAWSPDGKFVAFVSNRTDNPDGNDNSDIWIVAADNTDRGATVLQLTTNPGADYSPAWSPDGSQIAYVTVTEPEIIWYATSHLAVISSEGGSARVLTSSLDRNVTSPEFGPGGRWIYFGLEDSAERHLARIEAARGNLERPIDGQREVTAYTMSPQGRVAALISEPHMPGEIFMLERGGPQQLTFTNDSLVAALRLAEVENVHFTSRDGTEVEGFVFLPPGFDRRLRYPTLLRIHGGPVSQYDFGFSFEAQLFAAHGYVVVMVNPRGSSGYGQEFSLGIYQDWGNKDFEDVMAGIDYAIQQGYADPDRLGVGGWSYGGILTNYVITKTDRFKAAITGASEVLYIANYGHDHYQRQWEMELGLPWENRELWERISPFNYVQNIVTPTLIMGGEVDWNVPIQNSEQLYQALKRLGRTTQLVVYPGQHHGIRIPSYQKDRYERYLAWYDKYVRGGGASEAPVP